MMENWETNTSAFQIIRKLSDERAANRALQWGGQWPLLVESDQYVYLRRFQKSRCLTMLNRGENPAQIHLENVDFPNGSFQCLLTQEILEVKEGTLQFELPARSARVWSFKEESRNSESVVHVQINGAPTQPGDRLIMIGDCEELGHWDISKGYPLECVNSNTWFAELFFHQTESFSTAYKYAVLSPNEQQGPHRELRIVRRRSIPQKSFSKWRDVWEE